MVLFERFGDGVAALQVVADVGQHLPQIGLFGLLGQQTENAQGGHLRLKERRNLPGEDNEVAGGHPVKKSNALELFRKGFLPAALDGGEGKPLVLEQRNGGILRGGVDGAALRLAVLVECFVFKFSH